MTEPLFRDRRDAGRQLASLLARYRNTPDCLVIALPRGGVTVAYEIARQLNLPLDVCVVRKLGVPFQPELAMGAISLGGVTILHQDTIDQLGIGKQEVDRVIARETEELLRREQAYRGRRPMPDLKHKTVIVVDDGIATGATMEASIAAMRQCGAAKIVAAVGVAAPATMRRLSRLAEETVAVLQPRNLSSIGEWFEDFTQVSDDEVKTLLGAIAAEQAIHST